MTRKTYIALSLSLAMACVLILLVISPSVFEKLPDKTLTLTLTAPGVALQQPDVVTVATQLNNVDRKNALDVKIDSIKLDSAPLLTATPVHIGDLKAGQSVNVQADFTGTSLTGGKQYLLVMDGSYRIAHEDRQEYEGQGLQGDEHHDSERELRRFTVKVAVAVPPAAPGSATVNTITVPSNTNTGAPFPPQPPKMDVDVNEGAPVVPTTPFVPGVRTPTGTSVMPAPFGDPPEIVFNVNNGFNLASAGINCSGDSSAACAEPSGASGGGVIFMTANWRAAYSTDGGVTFTQVDPTTIFKNDAVGFCCDQIVQYAPSIDRFIWLLQGNGYRLATASPQDIINSKSTSDFAKVWTYWNLTPNVFGSCSGFDYPDLSVGNNSLYISWDAQAPGCTAGFQAVRTSLAGIQAGGTITVEFTDPANAPQSIVWGSHLTQDTGDEIFWAGHNGNSKLRVYSLAESSNTYFWRDVDISSWANNSPTSTTPDGQDWLAKNFNGPGGNSFPRNGVIGATRSGNVLWFAWTAGTNDNFRQPHIEMVALDRSNNFNRFQQEQIWNNDYAFAYPSLATNACTGEVGLSFEYGGNGNYENHVVGFWGDFVAYITTGSDRGTDRYGDYVTIRQAPATPSDPGNLFTAFGFGVNNVPPPGTGTTTDVHYVLFGRPASSCVVIP